MSDYWQVIRRLPGGGHQSIQDYGSLASAYDHAGRLNVWYQTGEYKVIHRTTEGLAQAMRTTRL